MSEKVIEYKDVTPVQKLDAALTLIADIEKGHLYKYSVMLVDLIQLIELDMVFNKLIKDGFAEKRYFPASERDEKTWDKQYAITFDGKLFHQQGGYAEQFRKDEYKKWLEDKLYKTTIDSNVSGHSANRLFWITLVVAIAGVVAPWLDYINDKDIDALKQQIKVLQVEQQQKQRQLFYNPAKP